ncbi:MAG TPA: DnaA regulatory inactivator Hda [Alcanivoracaceae bacterium]|nr:DnaA regulatory inactivator Hda [Alcanivoracaceae bacterium]
MQDQLTLPLYLEDGLNYASYVADENCAVVQATQAWAKGEMEQIFLYGEKGSGRSHLIHAAIKLADEEGFATCVLPCKELVQMPPEVLEGIEQFTMVAVDDVDTFAGQPEWEEALFHLYNRCRELGHSMLFSAERKPHDSGFQLPDLISRLGAGPVFKLQPLTDEGLTKLLLSRAKQRGMPLHQDVAHYIILRGVREPKALIELLDRLDKSALTQQRKLTIPFVKEVLHW